MQYRQDVGGGRGGSSGCLRSTRHRWVTRQRMMTPLSRWVTHMAGRSLPAVEWELSLGCGSLSYVLLHRLLELPPSVVAGFRERERVPREQGESASHNCDLRRSHTASLPLYSVSRGCPQGPLRAKGRGHGPHSSTGGMSVSHARGGMGGIAATISGKCRLPWATPSDTVYMNVKNGQNWW